MTVAQMKMFQHPYVQCHAYITYAVWSMHPSNLHTALHADQLPVPPHTHLPNKLDTICPSTMTVWTPQTVPAPVPQNLQT